MLTEAQINWISDHGISTLQDHWLTSLSSGEPFLEKGVLSYFDGRFVTVCGCRFRDSAPMADDDLHAVIRKWADERGVQAIAFLGPQPAEFRYLKDYGFRQTYREDANELSSELFLDCSDRAGSVFDRPIYRRSRKLRFDATLRRGGMISEEYLSLIELFYFARNITGYLADKAFTLPAVLLADRVWFVEARQGGKLCGFVGFHKPFRDIATAFFITHDHWTPGVCDFLYAKMAEQARAIGADRINIGTCPSDGHYQFKRKWGGKPDVPAYNYAEWARGRLATRRYKTWGPRIVKL